MLWIVRVYGFRQGFTVVNKRSSFDVVQVFMIRDCSKDTAVTMKLSPLQICNNKVSHITGL